MTNRRTARKITRRTALRQTLYGAAGLGLLAQNGLTAWAAPRKAKGSRNEPRAKAVIEIWLWGGPSHLDTFDPKPNAGSEYTGPLNKPIATNVEGIQIGQSLPMLAKQADKYSLIRSMTHGVNGHETATYMMQTGRKPGTGESGLVYPSIGSVVSQFRGYDHGYTGMIPPFVVLTRPKGRFAVEGFLGLKYKPFVTGGDPRQERFAVEGIVLQGVSDERQRSRRDLLKNLDSLGGAVGKHPSFEQMDRSEQKAYDLILGDAGKVFDLKQEPDAVRDRYGRNTFGQSCLVARRLVAQGVPYISINSPGWDTHKRHFESMRQKLPQLDAGVASLIEDLHSHGLLDSTIVWVSGEFGRGPKIQYEEPWNGGRSHYGRCFSALLAGGGFQGGTVVGSSDKTGSTVADRPVYPQDFFGSMYQQLGIDPDEKLPNPRGLDVSILPPVEKGSPGRLKEIM